MQDNKVIEFAKNRGYVGARHLGKWKCFDTYQPFFNEDEDELYVTGLPLVILVKGNEIRMSTIEETFEHLRDTSEE